MHTAAQQQIKPIGWAAAKVSPRICNTRILREETPCGVEMRDVTPITRYLDFDLTLTREGDQYMAEVRNSPAGPSQKVPLRWPFGTEPHEVLALRLENAILKGRGYRAGPISSEEKILREFGSDVFRAVLRDSDSVATKFATSLTLAQAKPQQGLRLVLRVDPPELAMLPWEYMCDASARDENGNYLCLRTASPLVRYLNPSDSDNTLQVDGPLRILGMIANPGTSEWRALDTEDERHRIEEAIEDDVRKNRVRLEWVRGGTADDLFDLMQRQSWHVFHFIGHGGTDRYVDNDGTPRAEGFVVMQDGRGGAKKVPASELGMMLEGDSPLRLAVLNCCDSGLGSTGLSSVGAALVNSGVPLAVAMQYAITDGSAARFAGMFYASITSGQSVEQALTAARRFMRLQSNVEWGIPVLFTRTRSCMLVEVNTDTTSVKLTSAPTSPVPPAHKSQAQKELQRLFM
jgi:CHAT domain